MKKIILFGIVFILLIASVIAGALNLARHTSRDFGTMSPGEVKTMGYYVKGYYAENDVDYSICVEHKVEGEIKKWIKLSLVDSQNKVIYSGQKCNGRNKHWVGPEREVTWIKNVFVKVKVPKNTLPGNYTGIVNNVACMPVPKGQIGFCNEGPTIIKVTVI